MSFFRNVQQALHKIDPLDKAVSTAVGLNFTPRMPRPVPGVPDQNQAANAARTQTDSMRLRRGMLANIYAGSSTAQPVTGKTQLGT